MPVVRVQVKVDSGRFGDQQGDEHLLHAAGTLLASISETTQVH
jgi:hypothetical protein